MNTKKQIITLGLLLAAALVLTSCNPIEDDTQSASLLTVLSLQGVDIAGNKTDLLQSDVVKIDTTTGGKSYYADMATATLKVTTLDPAPIAGTSQYNDVMLDRYVVSFSKPSGDNREGIDVPYSFEGTLTKVIAANAQSSISFVIVREVAKIEPPLIQLADGYDVLQCTARVDFYGHDLASKNVMATAYLTVYFANYADATGTPVTTSTSGV
jgi:hypothetical protein